jgi:hypothetical protein
MATETNQFGYTKATTDEIANANRLLKDQSDPLADILSLTEKINLGWKNTIKIQGELEGQLQKTHLEILRAQLMVQSSNATEQAEGRIILKSITQRKSELEKELGMLRVINSSGLAPMLFLWTEMWKLFKEMDKATVEFNMHLGMMRSSTEKIQQYSQKIAIDYMNVGVNIGIVLKSVEALGEVSGGIKNVSLEILKTTSLLNAQLGISQETSAGFFRNMAAISGTSMESQQNMAGYAVALSNAAGTNLNQVMSDLASKSSNTLMLLSHIPEIAIKSAVEFRKLGTSLDAVADGAAHILNFTSSIQEEMEASVLIGHSLNMQTARQKAYMGDLVGYNREVLKLAQQNHFLNGMDMFQKQAFANMTGKSVADLTAMVQAEKELTDAKNSTNAEIRAAATEYERLRDLNKEAAEAEGKNMLLHMQTKSNQERMVAIQQKWNQLVAQIMPPLLKITDWALSIVPPLLPLLTLFGGLIYGVGVFGKTLDLIGTKLTSVYGLASKLGQWGYSMTHYGMRILNIFTDVGKFFSTIGTKASSILGIFGSVGKLGSVLGIFAKFLGPIGLLITAFQFISGWVDGMKGHSGLAAIWYGLLGGLKAVVGPLYNMLIWPFNKFLSWFGASGLPGMSPSKLGLSIVKGIISVGAMLYDALTYPFRHAFAWILDHIPGMGKVASGLRDGFGGVATTINHKLDGIGNNEIKPSDKSTVTAEVSKNVKEQVVATKEQKDTSGDTNVLLQGVIDAINGLRKDLNAGKIAINLDGSRVSTYLARSDAYKGSFSSH